VIRSAAFLSSPPYISLIQIIYSQQQVFWEFFILFFTNIHVMGSVRCEETYLRVSVTVYDAGIEARR
jgi:hypothetical protein